MISGHKVKAPDGHGQDNLGLDDGQLLTDAVARTLRKWNPRVSIVFGIVRQETSWLEGVWIREVSWVAV